ncbi:MAG: hypothetical protein AAB462_01850 [Patescibacteria group bacterium]
MTIETSLSRSHLSPVDAQDPKQLLSTDSNRHALMVYAIKTDFDAIMEIPTVQDLGVGTKEEELNNQRQRFLLANIASFAIDLETVEGVDLVRASLPLGQKSWHKTSKEFEVMKDQEDEVLTDLDLRQDVFDDLERWTRLSMLTSGEMLPKQFANSVAMRKIRLNGVDIAPATNVRTVAGIIVGDHPDLYVAQESEDALQAAA